MPCYLLHMVAAPDKSAYDDSDLKDVVGEFPQLYCAHCNPPQRLKPSEATRCLDVPGPCWKRPNEQLSDQSL